MATATAENSFCLLADAEIYFDERLHCSAWNNAATEDKHRALIQATRIFNVYLDWNDEDGDAVIGDSDDLDETITDRDDALKWATCEMALVLLQGDTQVKDDMEGIDSIGLPGLSIKRGADKKQIIPPHVFKMISHLCSYKSGGSVMVVRS